MSRVGIVHFTAEPCIGGVEHVIELQRAALRRGGHDVRLVVGEGGTGEDVARIQQMRPPPDTEDTTIPQSDDPGVLELCELLRHSLAGCNTIWVHNVLTVYLNPALTVALLQLWAETRDLRWVAFCHDLTVRSRYWRSMSACERERMRPPSAGITYVVDSVARQREVAVLAGLAQSEIVRIPLPVDSAALLRPTLAAAQILGRPGVRDADPLLLVPAKLLPHKNLPLAVRVTASLLRSGRSPHLVITGPCSPHQPQVSRRVLEELLELARDEGVSDRLIIVGESGSPLDYAAVRDLMTAADLVFLPSSEEGYGLPVLEAIALRAPVLCSDIPSFREIGDGYAKFFPLAASPEETAGLALAMTATSAARTRRHVLRSLPAYESAIMELVSPATTSSP